MLGGNSISVLVILQSGIDCRKDFRRSRVFLWTTKGTWWIIEELHTALLIDSYRRLSLRMV